jgi:hypothetical protein
MPSMNNTCTCHRVIFIKDPSHREWNDVKEALKQAGMWQLVLETTFTWNQPYGPWEGASWFKSHQEAFRQVTMIGKGTQCPVLQFLADRIAADRGQVRALGEGFSDDSEMLLEESDFQNKGRKISLTRWFDWATAAEVNLPRWHSKLYLLLYQAISLGLIRNISEIGGLEGKKPAVCSLETVAGLEPAKKRQKIEEVKKKQGPEYKKGPGSTVADPDHMEEAHRDAQEEKPDVPGKKDKVPTAADSVSKMRMTCQALSKRLGASCLCVLGVRCTQW